MKKVTDGVRVTYEVFLGEFSKQWVGVCSHNGQRVRSIQRPTQALAEYDIRHNESQRFLSL